MGLVAAGRDREDIHVCLLRYATSFEIIDKANNVRLRNEVALHRALVALDIVKRCARGGNAAFGFCLRRNLILKGRGDTAFICDSGIPHSVAAEDGGAQGESKGELSKRRFHGSNDGESATVMMNMLFVSFAYAEMGRSAERAKCAAWSASW